jgi:cell division protein FtsZ
MGGGTGTGAAPVIARVAREMDLLTVGIVTKPFSFEGARRMRQAEDGIAELNKYVDSLIVIPNDRLKNVEGTNITLANAFEIADDVLRRGVQSVSDLINIPAFINLDFADVSAIMKNAGYAHMGVGSAKGPDKAQLAAMAAISSPLLETNITGATGVIMSITTSPDVQLDEVMVASQLINDEAHPNANIIWGANLDPSLDDEIKVTIIATGFSSSLEDDVKEAIDTVTEKRFQTREKESSFVRPEIKEEPRYESVQRPAEEPAASVEVAPEEPKTIINEIKSARTEEDEYATYENIFADLKRRSKK